MEERAKVEKSEATKLFDSKLNAMVATLDQYKTENQKTIELKNKEIADLMAMNKTACTQVRNF